MHDHDLEVGAARQLDRPLEGACLARRARHRDQDSAYLPGRFGAGRHHDDWLVGSTGESQREVPSRPGASDATSGSKDQSRDILLGDHRCKLLNWITRKRAQGLACDLCRSTSGLVAILDDMEDIELTT